MKFSITTTFYNNENYVNQIYNCILSQTYTNWEWIVTDDFSSDNTKSLLLSICEKDKRVKYVEQSKKKEMFWNPQFFCKDADLIVELGADDYIVPKSLEIYHHFFTKFTDVILIGCFSDSYHENGNWSDYLSENYNNINNLSSGKMLFLRAWRNNPNLNVNFNPDDWMKFFYNDLSIICTMEEYGKILCLPRVLYSYTIRNDSISKQSYTNIDELRSENDKLINLIKNRRPDPEFDSLERYFDPLYNDVFSLVDLELNNFNTSQRISLISQNLNPYKKKLFKELFFDMNFVFNQISKNNDITIYSIITQNDLDYFLNNFNTNYYLIGGKIFISCPRKNVGVQNEFVEIIFKHIRNNYNYSFKIGTYGDLIIKF